MCKPGEPCNEAKTATHADEFLSRIEMLIVMGEMYNAQKIDVPKAAVAMIDVIGPLLMEGVRKAKGWDGLQLAQEIIKQKKALFVSQGMDMPSNPLEEIIGMLGELMGEAKLREAMENGAPGDVHVFVMRGEDKPS